MSEKHPGIDTAPQLLQTAQDAVNRGAVLEMLEALTASRYLDGLTRRLRYDWRSLPSAELDDCVAYAVDAACAAAFRGRRIGNLGGWLFKAASNTANNRWQRDYSRRKDIDPDSLQGSIEARETSPDAVAVPELREEHRKEAIRIARKLLPRIGEGHVVDVMELLIDAAENQLPDLPSSSIAAQLRISPSAARALLSRGRKRLRRLAVQEGVRIPTDIPETDLEDDR